MSPGAAVENVINQTPASSGTNTVRAVLPPRGRISGAFARNATSGWQVIEIRLGSISNPDADAAGVVLVRQAQDGPSTGVTWTGQMKIGPSYRVIVATFYGCTALDALTLSVGVEE